jgi:hypothetical protein
MAQEESSRPPARNRKESVRGKLSVRGVFPAQGKPGKSSWNSAVPWILRIRQWETRDATEVSPNRRKRGKV